MAKQNQKNTKSAISDPKEVISESEHTALPDDSVEEEIILSCETLAEIGVPDKEQGFKKVAKAYEEVKRKREKYKKIGPIFVSASGVAFLTLIFTLENKITFLILWVITIFYTVALMVRAEYKYHQFRYYLGLTEEESDKEDEAAEEATNESEDDPPSDEQETDISENAEQEEQE